MACLTFALIALTGGAKVAAEQPRDGVFIHVSHGGEDPHRVLMALSMASIMSADLGLLTCWVRFPDATASRSGCRNPRTHS
jgi:hypothetical protein